MISRFSTEVCLNSSLSPTWACIDCRVHAMERVFVFKSKDLVLRPRVVLIKLREGKPCQRKGTWVHFMNDHWYPSFPLGWPSVVLLCTRHMNMVSCKSCNCKVWESGNKYFPLQPSTGMLNWPNPKENQRTIEMLDAVQRGESHGVQSNVDKQKWIWRDKGKISSKKLCTSRSFPFLHKGKCISLSLYWHLLLERKALRLNIAGMEPRGLYWNLALGRVQGPQVEWLERTRSQAPSPKEKEKHVPGKH